MKPLKLLLPMLLLLAVVGVAAILLVPRAYEWYLNLRHPASPKVPAGSTVWSQPAGSVAMAGSAPGWAAMEPAMSRQEADGKLTNPLPSSPETIAQGKRHFLEYCAHCHGADGKGNGPVARRAAFPAPNLALSAARRSEGFLYATIRNGGAMMPPQGHALSPQERWETVHFLKSIAQAAPPEVTSAPPSGGAAAPSAPEAAPASPATVGKGDAAKGKVVFESKCSTCHDATSDQEIVGPGLKDLFRWPPHQAPDGTQHAKHTVPMIRKQITQGGGAMPPVTGLSEQDLADLLAYMQTL